MLLLGMMGNGDGLDAGRDRPGNPRLAGRGQENVRLVGKGGRQALGWTDVPGQATAGYTESSALDNVEINM